MMAGGDEEAARAERSEWNLKEPEVSWGSAGANVLAVVDGRIAAVLYFEEEGEEVEHSGWWLVMADAPGDHHHIEAPAVAEGAPPEEAEEALDVALRMATLAVKERLMRGAR